MKVFIVYERLKASHGSDIVFLREVFAKEVKARAYCELYKNNPASSDRRKAYSLLGVYDRMFTISEMDVIE